MRLRLLILIPIALMALSGCGRVHYRYYVKLDNRALRTDLPLDLAYVHPRIKVIRDHTLEVQVMSPPDTVVAQTAKMTQPDNWQAEYEKWRKTFESNVADELWRSTIFGDVGTPSDPSPIQKPNYILRIAVTEWNEGNRWVRWIVGFGAGRTRTQWEGRLINAANGEELFLFADAREHPGGPHMFGLSFRPPKGPELITQDLLWAARDLARALREATGETRDWRGRKEHHRKYRYGSSSEESSSGRNARTPTPDRQRVGGP